jgi:hypothetical protein
VPIVGPPDGSMPLYKNEDPDAPQLYATGFVRQFEMGKPEDVQAYNQIVNSAAKGTAQLQAEDRAYDQAKHCWVLFVRWLEYYYATCRQVQDGAYRNDQGQIVFDR